MSTVTDQSTPPSPPRTVRTQRVMGTVVSFDLRGDGDHAAALEEAATWFRDVDRRFSTYRADSEVRRFGRGETTEQASADLAEVIARCGAIAAASGGAFSADLPSGFDPSGYVKGWSVDRAAAILRGHGCERWSINAGGDVLVSSAADARAPWRIGVQHPFDRGALGMVLQAEHLAVATSGRYERGDHVVDPRTGTPATGVASTTVCGPDLGLADAFATAAFVLAEEGPAWIDGLEGYECWTVLHDGRTLATAGFPMLVHGVPVRTTPTDPTLRFAA